MTDMHLDINDFGPIKSANLKIKKLNIIAGVNGSGKTTSSKLLYCLLTSFSNEKEYLSNYSIGNKFRNVMDDLFKEFEFDHQSSAKLKNIIANLPEFHDYSYCEKLEKSISSIKKIINDSIIYNKNEYIEKLTNIKQVLEITRKGNRKFFDVSNFLLHSEFKLKDLNLDDSQVSFYIKENDNCEFFSKLIKNESKFGFTINDGDSDCLNIKNVVYIDSLSIFNSNELNKSLILRKQPYHLRSLSRLLNADENDDIYESLFNQKLDQVKDEITSLIGGFIFYDFEDDEFKFKKDDDEYSMQNTASGVKQLGLIQRLLSNRTLNDGLFIIMDEPEVNLHPEWQVEFAQLIVMMIQKLDIPVFINSHSPQFIEALEVYSAKYGLSDETTFYLSKKSDLDKFDFEKISRDNIVLLYNNLGDPYKKINKIRAQNMKNDMF